MSYCKLSQIIHLCKPIFSILCLVCLDLLSQSGHCRLYYKYILNKSQSACCWQRSGLWKSTYSSVCVIIILLAYCIGIIFCHQARGNSRLALVGKHSALGNIGLEQGYYPWLRNVALVQSAVGCVSSSSHSSHHRHHSVLPMQCPLLGYSKELSRFVFITVIWGGGNLIRKKWGSLEPLPNLFKLIVLF